MILLNNPAKHGRLKAPAVKLTTLSIALFCAVSTVAAQDITMVLDPPTGETNRYWAGGSGFAFPPVQGLVGNHPTKGTFDNSALAESWEANDDFTVWTFHIKPEAEFHFGWGPVTAEDVLHSYELHVGPESTLAQVQLLVADEVEIIDDKTVAFHLPDSRPNYPFAHAERGSLFIYSKAQYDEEGLEGYDRLPAGTGALQYAERRIGESLKLEKVENHWSGQDVAYDTLTLRFSGEAGTKLAMLMAGEADLAALPRELNSQALSNGFGLIPSTQPSMQTTYLFGAQHHMPGDQEVEVKLPWHDVRIREAINRAVDREAVIDILYDGNADPLYVFTMDSRGEGYNPELGERFEEMYGFDPDKARALIAEAGYPDAFEQSVIPIISTTISGNPEFTTGAELMQSFLNDVGLETRLVELDWAGLNVIRRAREDYVIMPMRNAPIRPTDLGLDTFFSTKPRPSSFWERPDTEALLADYQSSTDVDERNEIASQLFEFHFENYTTVPLATVTTDVAYNPDTISGWDFPGASSFGFSHFHLIKPLN